jgi:hypothetical protein
MRIPAVRWLPMRGLNAQRVLRELISNGCCESKKQNQGALLAGLWLMPWRANRSSIVGILYESEQWLLWSA